MSAPELLDRVGVVDGERRAGAFDRRTALSAGLIATLTALGCDACDDEAPPPPATSTSTKPAAPTSNADKAMAAFVPVLVALAETLLPSDDLGPGAREAQLGPFFEHVFGDPRVSTVTPLLKRGCAFVMKVARSEGNAAFVDLDVAARDDIVGRLVDGAIKPEGFSGALFVRVVLALTLEGFLGDPRHGGNHGGVGWRFVGYAPDSRAGGLTQPIPAKGSLKVVP